MERFHILLLFFDVIYRCFHVRIAQQFSFHIRMASVYLEEPKVLRNLKLLLSKASTIERLIHI